MKSFASELSKPIQKPRLKEILKELQHIGVPSPCNLRLYHELITVIVPTFWNGKINSEIDFLLAKCFSTLLGLKLLCVRLDNFVQEANLQNIHLVTVYLELLEKAFECIDLDDNCKLIWESTVLSDHQKQSLWTEFIFFLGNFKITNSMSAAMLTFKVYDDSKRLKASSMADYIGVLSSKLACIISKPTVKTPEIYSKLFHYLLHSSNLKAFINPLIPLTQKFCVQLQKLFADLTVSDQMLFLNQLLLEYNTKYPTNFSYSTARDDRITGSLATLLRLNFSSTHFLRLIEFYWGVPTNLIIKRVEVVCSSISYKESDKKELEKTVDSLFNIWSNAQFLRSYTLLAQESLTIYLLLFIPKLEAKYLNNLSKSLMFSNAISCRLDSLDDDIRMHGMIMAEIISTYSGVGLSNPLAFDVPIMKTTKAKVLKSLSSLKDEFLPIEILNDESVIAETSIEKEETNVTHLEKPVISKNDDLIRGDDLEPYDFPDIDSEDTDDDPTVSRSKTHSPVYIQDLCKMLKDTESFEKQRVALENASKLIKRKSAFGTELRDHADELLQTLISLQNRFDLMNFDEMQMTAIVELLLTCLDICGPVICTNLFVSDYSMRQKILILSCISLAASKFNDDDNERLFPSQLLPGNLHDQFYSPTIEKISDELERKLVFPVMSECKDYAEGPKFLQTRYISKQSEIESKKPLPKANRLSLKVDKSLFLLLTSGYMLASRKTAFIEPLFLVYYLKTLGILFFETFTSKIEGANRMLREYIDVLNEVCRLRSDTPEVNEGLLFSFLAILEISSGRTLANEFGKHLLFFEAYTKFLFESPDQGEKVKSLSAAVLILFENKLSEFRTLALEKLLDDSAPLVPERFGLAGL